MTGAQRLVNAAKRAHREIGDVLVELEATRRRLSAVRRELAYAVAQFDSSAVTELPDDREPRD